jgi:hypothetical protein
MSVSRTTVNFVRCSGRAKREHEPSDQPRPREANGAEAQRHDAKHCVALFFSCSARCVYARPAGRMARRGQRYRRIRTSQGAARPPMPPNVTTSQMFCSVFAPRLIKLWCLEQGPPHRPPRPHQPQPACDPQRMYTIYVSTYLMSLEAFCAGGLGPILVGGSIILYN